jgi:hypothetical protein
VQKACSNFVGGWVQGGDNLDRAEQTAILHIAQAQGESEICGRFVGGPARNRALLRSQGDRGQFMQTVQSRINTGDCASR